MKVKRYKNINERVYFWTLKNKMKVYFIKKVGFQKKTAIIGTPFGSIDSIRKNKKKEKLPDGVAHFLEHRMFSIKDKDATELFSQNGAYSNAFTTYQQTAYYFDCSKNFYENLKILLTMLNHFDSTKTQVENEKSIIIEELNMYKDEPYTALLEALYKQAYGNHPISIDIGGSEESVKNTTLSTLQEVFSTFYDPSHLTLVVCGDLDEKELEQFLKENELSSKNVQKIKKLKICEFHHEISESFTTIYKDISVPMLGMLIRLPSEKKLLQRKAYFTFLLLSEYYFSLSSSFTEDLFRKKKITEAIQFEMAQNVDLPRIMLYNENKNYLEVREEILHLFQGDFAMSSEDFLRLKNSFYGRILRVYDDISELAVQYLTMTLANKEMFKDIKTIEEITLADVQEAFFYMKNASKTSCVVRRKVND